MIIQSLFLGRSGIYECLGIPVTFKKDHIPGGAAFADNAIGNLGESLLNSRIFHILTFGYLHTFVHEMGHALTHKVHGASSKIEILTTSLSGFTIPDNYVLSRIQCSIIALAGPLADVIFSVSEIFAAFALSAYLTLPVATTIAIGAGIWIFGEVFYAVDSVLQQNDGDFGMIAKNGFDHLMCATVIMAGVIALGIFATARIM